MNTETYQRPLSLLWYDAPKILPIKTCLGDRPLVIINEKYFPRDTRGALDRSSSH